MVVRGATAIAAAIGILLPLLCISCPSASAGEIIYVIVQEEADVYIQVDGSADIKYTLEITVRPHSDTVDSFNIRMPNWRFDEDGMSATIDGATVLGLSKAGRSEETIKVSLNAAEAMEPGSSHVFILVVNVGAMAIKHPSRSDMARLDFSPTSWDKTKVQEVQRLAVRIHLPEDYLDEGNLEFTDEGTVNEVAERLVINWSEEDLPANFKRSYRVDFPAEAVDQLYRPFWDLTLHYYKGYIILTIILVMVAVVAVVVKRALRRPYLKPFMKVESWGTRKGLGPIEAAIVLGRKKDLIATMYLFDLVAVGAVEVEDPKAMAVKVVNPDYEGRSQAFLRCIRGGRIDPISTSNMISSLEDGVRAKLEGYDIDETTAHYRAQGPKRWEKVSRTRPPSIDEALWLMTDIKARSRSKKAAFEGIPDWTRWKVSL